MPRDANNRALQSSIDAQKASARGPQMSGHSLHFGTVRGFQRPSTGAARLLPAVRDAIQESFSELAFFFVRNSSIRACVFAQFGDEVSAAFSDRFVVAGFVRWSADQWSVALILFPISSVLSSGALVYRIAASGWISVSSGGCSVFVAHFTLIGFCWDDASQAEQGDQHDEKQMNTHFSLCFNSTLFPFLRRFKVF